MNYLNENIRFLRRKKGLTQQELAEILDVKRASIGSYEEGRSEPKLETITKICNFFKTTIDEIINKNLSKVLKNDFINNDGEKLRVLTITVNPENDELITLVPVKAAAGYLNGYGDIDFIKELPRFSLPFSEISKSKTYRAFEIQGDSMLPIKSGSYILCEYVQNIRNIKSHNSYVLVTTDEGIVYKRVENHLENTQELLLKSDNKEYRPYSISGNSVSEIWKAIGYISFDLPSENQMSVNDLSNMVINLQSKLSELERK